MAVVCKNPSTHGDITSQIPSRRLSHSSQSEKATIAAIAMAAIAAPEAQISMRTFSPWGREQEKPECYGIVIERGNTTECHRNILQSE
jgi:hypothetical protein